jgi:hypothetical protein
VGEVKFNIDATIFKEQRCLWNMHVHQRKPRRVHKGKNKLVLWITTTTRSGGKGHKEAIKWLNNIGLSKVSIELYCKQVVDDITKRLNTNFMFDTIIDICTTSLRTYQNLKISFIRRQANSVAHLLTRTSLSYASFHIHDHIPSCIETVITDEMS